MATDTPRGEIRYFEDFAGWDVVADHPEVAVDTDPAVEVLTGLTGAGGVVRITMDAGQANIGGMIFGQTVWDRDEHLRFEARVRMSAIGTAAERFFVGFTDLQEDTVSEMPFSIATTTLTASADPNDAIGFFFEGDATNPAWYPASQNADAVVVDGVANVAAADRVVPVAGQWHTLSFEILPGGLIALFYVDGKEVLRHEGTTAVVADVALVPIIAVTEGTSAVNFDIDYVEVIMNRKA